MWSRIFPPTTAFSLPHDRGGDENSHLYLRELDGTERDLTPSDKVKANFVAWSFDRKSFFFTTNERETKRFLIFWIDI